MRSYHESISTPSELILIMEHVSRNKRYHSQSRYNNINTTFRLLNRYQQWQLRLFTILQEAGYNISVRKNLLDYEAIYSFDGWLQKKNMQYWISLCYERNWVVGSIRKIDVSDCIPPTASQKSAMSTNNILEMRGNCRFNNNNGSGNKNPKYHHEFERKGSSPCSD